MSRYEIEIDDEKIIEQINNILNTIVQYEIQHKYSVTNRDIIPLAVKELVYAHKDEIINDVVDRAVKEIVRKGLPKLLERGIAE